MTDDLCQCPTCCRMHKPLGAGKPPEAIARPSLLRERVLEGWVEEMRRSAEDVILELEYMLPRVPDGDVETVISNADIALIVSRFRELQKKQI